MDKRIYTKQIIAEIAAENNLTKKHSKKLIESLFNTVKKHLKAGDDVMIQDFGIFKNVFISEFKQYNKLLEKEIKIKGRNRVSFSNSQALKNLLNND